MIFPTNTFRLTQISCKYIMFAPYSLGTIFGNTPWLDMRRSKHGEQDKETVRLRRFLGYIWWWKRQNMKKFHGWSPYTSRKSQGRRHPSDSVLWTSLWLQLRAWSLKSTIFHINYWIVTSSTNSELYYSGVLRLHKFSHITPVLATLHCSFVNHWGKIALLVYKALNHSVWTPFHSMYEKSTLCTNWFVHQANTAGTFIVHQANVAGAFIVHGGNVVEHFESYIKSGTEFTHSVNGQSPAENIWWSCTQASLTPS